MKRYSLETGNISSPSLDTSLGLIFRLNNLWQKTDAPAASGDFDRWNFILDRIFCNLLFKNGLDVTTKNGKVIKVNLCEEDQQVYEYLNQKVLEAKQKMKNAKTKLDFSSAKGELYKALMMKDVGLRKFMNDPLKLYLKQIDSNPARAMWGS